MEIRKHPQFKVYQDDLGVWHIKYYKAGNGKDAMRKFRLDKISEMREVS